jgi:hypothetical protein
MSYRQVSDETLNVVIVFGLPDVVEFPQFLRLS